MTDLAAPPLVFRRRSTLERLEIDPALEIGAGGEAVVYHLAGDASRVAKVYHEPTIERARKLALMLANPPVMPRETRIAWPADLLLSGRGFAGFLMPFAEGPRVFEFYNPVTRRAHAPGFHAGLLHRAGRNLAAAFDALHAAGYVVGDVNESNLLVSPGDASVTLVDADSLQVRDPDGGVFRSRVGKPEFTPPELQGVSFAEVDRTPEHDRFGLAVLLYLLLMEGTHPFAARLEPGRDAAPVEERIRSGRFPHARPDDDCHPPRLSPRFDALDEGVREMFVRAFVAGHRDPAARPAAAEWRAALEAAEARLARCAANPLHRHAPHLPACPWCERTALLGGRDPFPKGKPAVLRMPRPRPPRPVARPASAAARPGKATVSPYGVRKPLRWMMPGQTGNGPGPILNPVAFIAPAAVFAFGGSALVQLVGLLGLFLCLVVLVTRGFGRLRVSTLVSGGAMLACALIVTVPRAHADDDYEPGDAEFTAPARPVTRDPFDQPPAAGPVANAARDNPETQGLERFLLPDLVAYGRVSGKQAFIPPLPDDGGAAALPAEGYARELPYVADHPYIRNEHVVQQALAGLAASNGVEGAQADTVVFWVRIGADGRVPAGGGWQVISSTSRRARDAASAAIPYLRYEPARDAGTPVSVWAAQRIVFVP
jgi:hypothetical protein